MTVSFLNWGVHDWRPSHSLRPTPTTVEPLRVSPPEAVTYLFELVQILLLTQPGTQWAYSISVDVQGYLVEQMSGRTLGEFLEERIFAPLVDCRR